ncbi:M24 family metallopeptidase [Pseudalkalibacillus berkeleyi]|uniref:Xaa-Pro peptidase family protein n=1 Tax=Pseudalkalibacillus berkeleyi TaxID=1069813 RepID=A0ABS9H1S3_9BACL|nr:Xaa-Pro peptidase family protein [Pseudalkalibacillus berkeleyi]MCF6137864.1 Xaa-Pro peptidase family protein [Pseudalkalibacillus berkeleyi]
MNRIERLRSLFSENGIDGMLITSASNRRYMSTFTGSSGVVLISSKEAKLITDFRYIDQANEQATGYEIVKHTGLISEEVAKQTKEMGIQKLGFEQDYMTYAGHQSYQNKVDVELVPISGVIEKLRLVKDKDELKVLKEAAELADKTFEHILTFIQPGMREIDVSNELEFFMRKNGATSSSFDIIVASGIRSSLPHGVASEKVIEKGDMITLDFGALYKGYCSDITRTIAVGEPSDKMKEIHQIVLDAQLKGLEGLKPGLTGKEADALTRDYIKEHGYGENFGHSTGHGIGLDVHEGPGLSFKVDTVLEPGMVVTVEPGIYVSGLGGVRIEDDVVITETGCEKLSTSSKELFIIGE